MSIPHANADAKVREIVRRYRPIEELHPVVSEMYDDPEFERMFWDCLAHDSLVIRRRSQNLADGEITAVQKAFRILMDDKKDGLAAIELYVDEIIGLEVVSETDRAQMLATTLQTRDYILNRTSTSIPVRRPFVFFMTNTKPRIHRIARPPESMLLCNCGQRTNSSSER